MIASVEDILDLSANLLGDPSARKFNASKLTPFFRMAFEELTGEMARYHIRMQRVAALYTLPSGTTTLTPATAGIDNLGTVVKIEERADGSADKFTLVKECDNLPQRSQEAKLFEYEYSAGRFGFVGATQDIELQITYLSSGSAPTTGSVGIDGAQNFLAHRTAALAAIPAGNVELGMMYDQQARGPNRDGSGGFIHTLIQMLITAEQQVQQQLPVYKSQSRVSLAHGLGISTS